MYEIDRAHHSIRAVASNVKVAIIIIQLRTKISS